MSLSSPFGLATKPDNPDLFGVILGVTTKLLTIDANPTIAYKIAPGVTIGAGVQISGHRPSCSLTRTRSAHLLHNLAATDWAFGGTAGIMLEPLVVRRSASDIVRD